MLRLDGNEDTKKNTGNTVENLLALQAVQLVFESRWELGIDHDDDSAIH